MSTKTQSESLKKLLGSDLKFPIVNNFEPISGIDLLLQDIQLLLLTLPGERVGRPDYGCNLRNQIWENLDEALNNGISDIQDALEKFEPRISVLNVTGEINKNTSLITFNIQFLVNTIDSPINLVFPFRVGTSLSLS